MARSTLPPRTTLRSTTASNFPRRMARRPCRKSPNTIEAEIAACRRAGAGLRAGAKPPVGRRRSARLLSGSVARRSSISRQSKRPSCAWSSIPSGAQRADIRTPSCAKPESKSPPCTTTRDVLFGGHAPEPDDHLLEDLRAQMSETHAHIGIATDGDADRFGIVDEDGTFFQPNYIIALLFDYLVESRGWKNGVAKSVATTNLINALATTSRHRTSRNAGRLQIHRRTDQAGQDRHRRRGERGPLDPPSCSGKRWRPCRAAVLRNGGAPRQIPGRTITASYLSKLVPFIPGARTSA